MGVDWDSGGFSYCDDFCFLRKAEEVLRWGVEKEGRRSIIWELWNNFKLTVEVLTKKEA